MKPTLHQFPLRLLLRHMPTPAMAAWMGQVFTGLLLFIQLLLAAILYTTLYIGPDAFSHFMGFTHHFSFFILEMCTLLCLFYHILNGIRIFLLDLGIYFLDQRDLFFAVCILALLLLAIHLWPQVKI